MATRDVQSPVQLTGKGATYKLNDNFNPGEYKMATNVILDREGQLKNRPPIQGYWSENNEAQRVYSKFVGNFGSDAIFSVFNGDIYQARIVSHRRCSTDANLVTFRNNACSIHPSGAAGSSKVATVVGYTIYNNEAYALVVASFRPAASNDRIVFLTVMKGPLTSVYTPGALSTLTTAGAQVINSVTLSGLYPTPATYYTNNIWVPTFFVKDWLIHKDRMWIGVGDTLYFSDAGNLLNFTAPDGGFTKFPNHGIVSLSTIGDTIYSISDSRIYAVSYNTDFNVDGQVTLVSDVIGGNDSVAYGDSIYVINSESLYRIDGFNVSKVMDIDVLRFNQRRTVLTHNNTTFSGGSFPDYRIQAFEDNLYIISRFIKPNHLDINAITPFDVRYDISYPSYDGADISSNPSCMGINMTNGFITYYSWGSNGEAYDAMYVPTNDSFNQSRLFFLGNQATEVDSSVFSMGSNPILVTNASSPTNPVTSEAVNNFNIDSFAPFFDPDAIQYEIPANAIALVNLSPDNLRHVIKKLRTLEVEGSPPYYWKPGTPNTQVPFMWIYVFAGANFEESISAEPSNMNGIILSSQWMPVLNEDFEDIDQISRRFGINQRCRRYSIVITTRVPTEGVLAANPVPVDNSVALANPYRTTWNIGNILTRWTYSDRAGTNLAKDLS